MGAPCHLECVPCSDKEGLQQFRGGEWVAPKVDPEWIDPPSQGQPAPTWSMAWPHHDNYWVPQFLDAFQSGQNSMASWALGTSWLAIFSNVDSPLPKGEATYNQWAFEVRSLQSCSLEEVLWDGIIWSLKGNARDIVQVLGPATSVDVILEKLDSLYGSVSTFDVMMYGFYRKSQGKSESVACYIARLEGKLNEIWIKHLNRVSEMKITGYNRDHLFYGLRKPICEAIHAKFNNPMNHYMALMWAARRAEGEHEQEKHNNSCVSKSGVVSDVSSGHEGNPNPDSEDPTWEPWAKWVEVQQQLMAAVKGTQNALKKTQW